MILWDGIAHRILFRNIIHPLICLIHSHLFQGFNYYFRHFHFCQFELVFIWIKLFNRFWIYFLLLHHFNARKLKTFFISFQILLQLPKLSKGRKITRNKIPEKVNLTSKLFFDMASDMHQSEHLANISIGTIILVTKMWSVKGPFIVIDAFKRTNLTLSRQVFVV